MKKLMGISVIAALAVMPMAANAARDVSALGDAPTVTNPTSTLATASFVTGAYDAVKTQVNNLITDTAVAAKQGGGDYAAITAGDSVSGNLVALDNAIAGLQGNGENSVDTKIQTQAQNADFTPTSGMTANKIGAAINELDGEVDTLQGQMGDTALDNADGLTATTVTAAINELQDDKQEKSDSQVTSAGNYLTTGYGVGANLEALDTAVGKVAELEAGQSYNTGIASNKTVAQNLQALDTAIGNINSASGSVQQNGNYITTTNTVSQNLGALDTAIGKVDATNQYHIATANDVATNLEGLDAAVHTNDEAIATINNKQIPIVTNWSTGAVTNTTISQLVTATGGGSGTSGE